VVERWAVRVVHFEVGAADPERARRFYEDLFGWKIMTDASGYGLVDTGSDDLGIRVGVMPSGGRPSWVTVYVALENLEESLTRAEELGGRRLMGPTPLGEAGSFALFNDPEGNMIGLFVEL
jgi:predicted enzyme related to lactoylglutathione lyase